MGAAAPQDRVSLALRLVTARLELVPATEEMLVAEIESNAHLAEALGATVPPGWPPGLWDRGAAEWMLQRTREGGEELAGWYGWYGLRPGEPRELVLSIGYFGPPREGVLEIGYSVVVSERGRGYAREAIAALTARAVASPGVTCVCAHTAADNVPSQRALRHAGFAEAGPGAEPGTLRYEWRPGGEPS